MKYTMPINCLNQIHKNRFWEKVAITANPNECWNWLAFINGGGYGVITANMNNYMAHRFSYFITTGIDPKELLVLHNCDNPPCVNPNHLFLGTSKDNTMDCIAKKRFNRPYGENHKNSKLSNDQVITIREYYNKGKLSLTELAKVYHMTYRNMVYVAKGKTWKHVKTA